MKEHAFCYLPMLNLIEYACTRLKKRKNIAGYYSREQASSVHIKLCTARFDANAHYAENNRTKSAENRASVKKSFKILIHFIPNLSFTFFRHLLET